MTDGNQQAPRVPAPPTSLSEEEREAWLHGAFTIARAASMQNEAIADRYADELGLEHGEDDDETERCDDCGAELEDALGGPCCPNCD